MAFNDRLRVNRVALVRSMDSTPLIDHLLAANIFTRSMAEEFAAKITTSDKNAYILDILPRRGPTTEQIFLKALVDTHQRHLAALFDYSTRGGGDVPPVSPIVVKRVFRKFTDCVASLKPTVKSTERSGEIYLTSVSVYSEQDATSSLGLREIPFVFAAKSGLYGKDTVLSWPNAPSKIDFERASAVYDFEIAELVALVSSLEGGGIEFSVRPNDDRLHRLIASLRKPYLTVTGGSIRLQQTFIACDQCAANDINVMAAALHLMCFGTHEFVIRKTTPPRPNSYLIKNAAGLSASPVIMDRDRKWVHDTVVGDESVALTLGSTLACPW
jgi:hypothetical protein